MCSAAKNFVILKSMLMQRSEKFEGISMNIESCQKKQIRHPKVVEHSPFSNIGPPLPPKKTSSRPHPLSVEVFESSTSHTPPLVGGELIITLRGAFAVLIIDIVAIIDISPSHLETSCWSVMRSLISVCICDSRNTKSGNVALQCRVLVVEV